MNTTKTIRADAVVPGTRLQCSYPGHPPFVTLIDSVKVVGGVVELRGETPADPGSRHCYRVAPSEVLSEVVA